MIYLRYHGQHEAELYDDWEALLEDCAEDGYGWVAELLPSGPKDLGMEFDSIIEEKRLEMRGYCRDYYTGQIRRIG